MKPLILSHMSSAQLDTLAELHRRVQKIPDDFAPTPLVPLVNCHLLADALAAFTYPCKLELKVGWYASGSTHSWFTDDTRAVYDIYPIGTLPAAGFGPFFLHETFVRKGGLYETFEECRERFKRFVRDGECEITYDYRRIQYPYKRTSSYRKAVRVLREVMA